MGKIVDVFPLDKSIHRCALAITCLEMIVSFRGFLPYPGDGTISCPFQHKEVLLSVQHVEPCYVVQSSTPQLKGEGVILTLS